MKGLCVFLRHSCGLFGLLLLVGLAQGEAPKLLFKVSNAGQVTMAEMVRDLAKARIVIVGESHDNPAHHQAQLAIIRALGDAGASVAIGLEMFRADAQEHLNRWVDGTLSPQEFLGVYADNWDLRYWPVYADIFYHARREKVPMVGLNVPRSVVREVARAGFNSLTETQKGVLSGVACDVSPEYQRTLALVLGAKEADDAAFGRFCEAQVVWDTAMALNAIEFAERHPDRVIVVLAGNFHSWKHGIAEQIRRRSILATRVVLPSSDRSFFRYDIFIEDADYVWWFE